MLSTRAMVASFYATLFGLSATLTRVQVNKSLPPGIVLVKADNLDSWDLDIKVLDANPIYLDQTYRLNFKFGKNYPIGRYLPTSISSTHRMHR